jgi:RNA polymerase sigma factor (sigma-70 family)
MTRQTGGEGNELFESLYRRYFENLRRYFQRMFRVSDADAQDLTQDSFIRFFKSMSRYRAVAEWALLEEIARNVAYNHIRSVNTIKRGRVRPESLDDGESVKDAADPRQVHPIDTMIETEQLQRVQEAIAQLPNGQRQCLQLWLDDRGSDEIARILRLSVVAVKSRIRDAKRALRERLGDEAPLPEDWNHDEQN